MVTRPILPVRSGDVAREMTIDFRSDAMSMPTEEMWQAMQEATLGWVPGNEDQNVREIENIGAGLFGKESALFVPTCSMANLLALLSLAERGSQVVLESASHTVVSEHWGLAHVCGLFPRLLKGRNGILEPNAVKEAIVSARDLDLPRTSLVCLENSHNRAGGIPMTAEQTKSVADIAHRYGASVHLDGARLFNSAAALECRVGQLTEDVDSVSLSLNKGLCAPYGALLCGSKEMVDMARVNLERLGGASVHKAGMFAAAGIVALTKMLDQPGRDNRRGAKLALEISQLSGLHLNPEEVRTNVVLIDTEPLEMDASSFAQSLAAHGILVLVRSKNRIRFVTHNQIQDDDIEITADKVSTVLSLGV